jgi:acetamidase/formamidase
VRCRWRTGAAGEDASARGDTCNGRVWLQLASIAANVAITQLVDGKVGVHVKIPKDIFVQRL